MPKMFETRKNRNRQRRILRPFFHSLLKRIHPLLLLLVVFALAGCSDKPTSPSDHRKTTPADQNDSNSQRPANASNAYTRDSFLRTLSMPATGKRRSRTSSEQSKIDLILRVVETNNFDGWQNARETLLKMGNGAIDDYIVAMFRRLAKDSETFVNPKLDKHNFTVDGSMERAEQSLFDRRPPSDFRYLDDDLWIIVESELGQIGIPAIIPLLIIVKSCSNSVQSYLFGTVLSDYGEDALIPMLVTLRDTNSGEFRYRLTYLLRYFPDSRTSSALTTVLEAGTDSRLRAQAADSLSFAGLSQSITRISRVLRKERDALVRKHIIYALGHMADPKAMDAVTEAIDDPEPSVWSQAVVVVAQRKHVPAMPKLIRRLQHSVDRSKRDKQALKEANFIAGNLKTLTGFNLGFNIERWQRWYDAEIKKDR